MKNIYINIHITFYIHKAAFIVKAALIALVEKHKILRDYNSVIKEDMRLNTLNRIAIIER